MRIRPGRISTSTCGTCCWSADDDPAPPPGESQQVRWFTLAEAMDVADDALIDGLRRLQDYLDPSEGGVRSCPDSR